MSKFSKLIKDWQRGENLNIYECEEIISDIMDIDLDDSPDSVLDRLIEDHGEIDEEQATLVRKALLKNWSWMRREQMNIVNDWPGQYPEFEEDDEEEEEEDDDY